MFFAVFCNIHWRTLLSCSHSIIHPIQEWSGSQRQFRFFLVVFNDELLCSSLRANNGFSVLSWFSPSSKMKCLCSLFLLLRETRLKRVCSSLRANNGFHRSIIHQFINFSSPRFSDAEDDRVEGALAIKLIIGLDFAVTLSSPESCCVLFDITSEQSVELKWLTLNKHKRWFHSSRAEFPLVSMSASFFLVSRNLIWIFGSNLIRSNNQSRATLWVLETCLIVGLPPFKTLLITASLSSNTNNKASWCENWTFERTRSTLFKTLNIPRDCWPCAWLASRQTTGFTVQSWFRVVFPRTETIRSHKSRAGIPSDLNPASKEMISDSVELCETEVCFLNIQLVGTNVWLPKRQKITPEVDFESSRSPAKSESWNSPSLHCFVVSPT